MILKYIRTMLVPVAVMVSIPETSGRDGGSYEIYEARYAPFSH